MGKERKIQVSIQLPPDLIAKIDEIKATWGSSRNFVIERALRTFFAEDIEMKLKKSVNYPRLKAWAPGTCP